MRRIVVPTVVICCSLALAACKGGRGKLEQLVPDGATGMVSIDAKGLLESEAYAKVKEGLNGLGGDAKPQVILDQLRSECDFDPEKAQGAVFGFDAISQNVMGAIRIPNVGKLETLKCFDEVVRKNDGDPKWTLGESDGKATITSTEDGEVQGWAMDDDTLVISTKGWSSAVQARIKGESKGAVDNSLKEAVALADRGKHVWFAGQVPAIVEPFLEDTPAKGLKRGGGSIHYGENLEVAIAVEFADEAAAKAMDDVIRPQLNQFKEMAVMGGLPQEAVDSVEIELDGAIVRGKAEIPMTQLLDSTTQAFSKYMNRSKTSEARVQIAKMFDSASAYFNEEHVAKGALDVMPHGCPNDGRTKGEAGVTPPLSVSCNDRPGKRCVPGEDYDMALWTGNPVWNGLNFQMEHDHYFHYNFRWENDPSGFGSCMFTAQAFGDLDGDGIFSTYERSGAADQNGVNAAAGLYIDQELE